MKFINGTNRNQLPLFASSIDDAIAQDNEIRLIDPDRSDTRSLAYPQALGQNCILCAQREAHKIINKLDGIASFLAMK